MCQVLPGVKPNAAVPVPTLTGLAARGNSRLSSVQPHMPLSRYLLPGEEAVGCQLAVVSLLASI